MASNVAIKVFNFQGGYATDLAPQVRELSFLTKAENVLYEVSGAIRKVGGSANVNGTVLTNTPSVLGGYDFWLSGSGGVSTQDFVIVTSDGRVYKEDDGDGTFDNVTGAATIASNSIPVFFQARDLLVILSAAGGTVNTPLKFNQTGNVASLGGSPPSGRTGVFHLNRGWIAGTNANPSRLFYSSSTDIEDWTGADTGSIDVDPEDGDRIVGLASYKNNLFVFKGPYKGSIHIISGRTVATFARDVLVRGIALQTHNSIVNVGDDMWYQSHAGIHSLAATEKFANFTQSLLTRYLQGFFRTEINRGRLSNVWGVNYEHKGCTVWCMTDAAGTVNNLVFGLSYIRLQEEGLKAFTWTNRSCQSATIRINPTTNLRELVFGTNTGFVQRQDISNRSLAGSTAYTARIQTPQILLASQDRNGRPKGDQPFNLKRIYLKVQPTGNYNATVQAQRDQLAPDSYTFNLGSGGFILDTSVLDTDTLGGGNLTTIYPNNQYDVFGDARSVSFDIQQGGLNEDLNLYELGIEYTPITSGSAAVEG